MVRNAWIGWARLLVATGVLGVAAARAQEGRSGADAGSRGPITSQVVSPAQGRMEDNSREPIVPPIRRVHPSRLAKEVKHKARGENVRAPGVKKSEVNVASVGKPKAGAEGTKVAKPAMPASTPSASAVSTKQ